MHSIIEATAELCRRRGVDVDRTTARLTLLAVVEHLDRVLQPAETVALADALPVALSILLRREPRADRPPLELEEPLVRSACEALAMATSGTLAELLFGDVPDVLLGRRARGRQPSYVDPMEAETVRPPPPG